VLQPAAYLAVDISVDYLHETLLRLQAQHPQRPCWGWAWIFRPTCAACAATDWLADHGLAQAPRCVFYPGSSIGNFAPAEALRLLRQAHALCQAGGPGGGLLIGVDRVKDRAVLEPAYDDALGVTAAFNRNLLLHVNRLLGTDFAPQRWRHVAFFNGVESRIEMHLESQGAQTVRWPGGERHFADGERMHTENSYKWSPEAFAALLQEAGFQAPQHWTDARGWFSVFWAGD
jgi:L-histidine Nalpha-methyltransferase